MGGWRALYPDSRVISSNTGFTRNYRNDPIRAYKEQGNPELLFPMPVDEAYISFWFAWAAFQPETVLWTDGA